MHLLGGWGRSDWPAGSLHTVSTLTEFMPMDTLTQFSFVLPVVPVTMGWLPGPLAEQRCGVICPECRRRWASRKLLPFSLSREKLVVPYGPRDPVMCQTPSRRSGQRYSCRQEYVGFIVLVPVSIFVSQLHIVKKAYLIIGSWPPL